MDAHPIFGVFFMSRPGAAFLPLRVSSRIAAFISRQWQGQ
ncbi:hypothetical protein BSIN_1126 [Burkholderia singularis]|uniref:Uncharacterized protein n=1 Tax=Burkholderia singularis TaxID=1503053 RepID=A0A238HC66_9BURK|nr:hypothetical protein BSIN_1126 [Burkholderia singularis]